ncbi:MAG: glycosyl transferase, partial [Bacteroidales bacterium]|nr:glycosyl transferase [Bacteroidales bacterium]
MSEQELNSADFVFEISWESCNKVGGIYTVLSTKAAAAEKQNGVHIFMGPDVWKETADNPYFIEDNSLFPVWKEKANAEGLLFRTGRWNIPG